MARPHPDDIAKCMVGALGAPSLARKDAYTSAINVVRSLAGFVPGDGAYSAVAILTNDRVMATNWWNMTIQENCAFALELYKEHYPEG